MRISSQHFSLTKPSSTRSRRIVVSFRTLNSLLLRNTLGSKTDSLLTGYLSGALSKILVTIFNKNTLQFCLNSSLSFAAPKLFFMCFSSAHSVTNQTLTLGLINLSVKLFRIFMRSRHKNGSNCLSV